MEKCCVEKLDENRKMKMAWDDMFDFFVIKNLFAQHKRPHVRDGNDEK